MTIFELAKHYATPWTVLEERKLTDEDKAVVASAEVVKGDYGHSVCFHMTYGGRVFFSIDEDNSSPYSVGDKVNVDNITYKKLEKKEPDGSVTTCEKVII